MPWVRLAAAFLLVLLIVPSCLSETPDSKTQNGCCSFFRDGDGVVQYPRDSNWINNGNLSPFKSSSEMHQHWKANIVQHLSANPTEVILWNTGTGFSEKIVDIITGVVIGNETVLAAHLKLRQEMQKLHPGNHQPVDLDGSLSLQRSLSDLAKRHPKIIRVEGFSEIAKPGLWLSTYGSGKSWYIGHKHQKQQRPPPPPRHHHHKHHKTRDTTGK